MRLSSQPQSKPATLLHTIESQVDPRLLHEIQRELQLLDESLDFALEFEGARTQLVRYDAAKARWRCVGCAERKAIKRVNS